VRIEARPTLVGTIRYRNPASPLMLPQSYVMVVAVVINRSREKVPAPCKFPAEAGGTGLRRFGVGRPLLTHGLYRNPNVIARSGATKQSRPDRARPTRECITSIAMTRR